MDEWYIAKKNKSEGPYTKEQVQELIDQGEISEITLVWKEGFKKWIRLGESEFYEGVQPQKKNKVLNIIFTVLFILLIIVVAYFLYTTIVSYLSNQQTVIS